jgi:alpha-beta hydrolase superfamily lysophospholipase
VSTDSRTTPYTLEEQISLILSAVERQYVPFKPPNRTPYTTVTLVGHSVGSYILLEVVQRLRRSSSPIIITAGILLFPTITHIAQSPNGTKLAALSRIPHFSRRASQVAKFLIFLAPEAVLKWLVGVVTRMPEDATSTTTRFLTSRMGIWQAL